MKNNKRRWLAALAAVCSVVSLWVTSAWGAGDLNTKFSNQGTVGNTRHNMTQRSTSGTVNMTNMDPYRNDYGEVCVYCHTPHAANANIKLPLWNRTIKTTTYTTYAALGTSSLTQPVTQPGPNSLSCLSCHDGQVAVDSIINMPGSDGYNAAQATAAVQNTAFLDAWTNPGPTDATVHVGLDPIAANGCLACHSAGAGFVAGAGATSFDVFLIGTDLRNDHPVGVRFPPASAEFNPPTATQPAVRWFDTDGDGRPDTNEVRMYSIGSGEYSVECASCHDPHGVPSGSAGSIFKPSFLRVSNTASALCLTCQIK
jgi:mono/diheme cytochrome c family protein